MIAYVCNPCTMRSGDGWGPQNSLACQLIQIRDIQVQLKTLPQETWWRANEDILT